MPLLVIVGNATVSGGTTTTVYTKQNRTRGRGR
jgi:hypothetical protein